MSRDNVSDRVIAEEAAAAAQLAELENRLPDQNRRRPSRDQRTQEERDADNAVAVAAASRLRLS